MFVSIRQRVEKLNLYLIVSMGTNLISFFLYFYFPFGADTYKCMYVCIMCFRYESGKIQGVVWYGSPSHIDEYVNGHILSLDFSFVFV